MSKVIRKEIIDTCASQGEHGWAETTYYHCPYCAIIKWDTIKVTYVCMRGVLGKFNDVKVFKEIPKILKYDRLEEGEKINIPAWCPLPDAPEAE